MYEPVVVEPVLRTTSPLLLPLAVTISQANTKNRYSLFRVMVVPGFQSTCVIPSVVVVKAAVVEPTAVAAVSSAADAPLAFTLLKTRIRILPVWDEAVVALARITNDHVPEANVPVSGAGVLKALAVVPVRNDAGFGVVEFDENVPLVCFVPASNSDEFGEAISQPSSRLHGGRSLRYSVEQRTKVAVSTRSDVIRLDSHYATL